MEDGIEGLAEGAGVNPDGFMSLLEEEGVEEEKKERISKQQNIISVVAYLRNGQTEQAFKALNEGDSCED
ncbi:hypothetical protein Fmac_029081 [Flemingia macrophylla]|uniref:Uncharacterized protein n=1 Tax=Flemingia macrophylla TaxID=520843 RepID=A0ABD1L9B1_9FABA